MERERELSNNIRSSLVRKGVVYRSFFLFTKVRKGHRVIKVYVKNIFSILKNCQNFRTAALRDIELGEIFAVYFVIVLTSQLASREL